MVNHQPSDNDKSWKSNALLGTPNSYPVSTPYAAIPHWGEQQELKMCFCWWVGGRCKWATKHSWWPHQAIEDVVSYCPSDRSPNLGRDPSLGGPSQLWQQNLLESLCNTQGDGWQCVTNPTTQWYKTHAMSVQMGISWTIFSARWKDPYPYCNWKRVE